MQDDPWIGWKGTVAHPNSFEGAGGPGKYRSAKPLGTCPSVPNVGPARELPDTSKLQQSAGGDVVFIELLDYADKGANVAEGIKMISAAEAFRKYSWLKDMPIKNASGNFRGMVISAQAHSVYQWTNAVGEYAGNLLTFLSFAEEAYKAIPEAQSIANSSDDGFTKAAKISSMVSGVCIRTVWKFGTGVVDTSLWVLQKTKYVNPGYWFDYAIGKATVFDENIKFLRGQIPQANAAVDQFTSDGSLYQFINVTFGH